MTNTTEAALRRCEQTIESHFVAGNLKDLPGIYAIKAVLEDIRKALSQPSPASSTAGEAVDESEIADLVREYDSHEDKHFPDYPGNADVIARKIMALYSASPSPQPDMGSEEAVSLSDILTKHDRTERYQHLGEGNRHYTCDAVEVLITDIKAALSPPASGEPASVAVEADNCDKCDDSGYIRENGRQEFCDCICGHDAMDQAEGVGLHALSKPTPVEAGLREALDLLKRWKDWSCGQVGLSPFHETRSFLSALSETQPPRETSTETKESGE